MKRIVLLARETVSRYSLIPPINLPQLFEVLSSHKILIRFYPFLEPVTSIYVRTSDDIELLSIKQGLPNPELKTTLAISLGHHYLHNTGVYVHGLNEGVPESQAADFASLLLMPQYIFNKANNLQDIVEAFGVPKKLVNRRLQLEERLARLSAGDI